MTSILQTERRCYKTGTTIQLDKHHVMNGAYRKKAEEYGLYVYLNHTVHMWLHSTGEGQEYARHLKSIAQKRFEEIYSHELWMKEFKKNYE